MKLLRAVNKSLMVCSDNVFTVTFLLGFDLLKPWKLASLSSVELEVVDVSAAVTTAEISSFDNLEIDA